MSSDRKVALVTGASSGIGRSIAVALAKAGYDLGINYGGNEAAVRETEALVKAEGREENRRIEFTLIAEEKEETPVEPDAASGAEDASQDQPQKEQDG